MKKTKSKLTAKSQIETSVLLDRQLCFALYAASHKMTKTYQPILKKLDLTYPQYLVLLVLWEKSELSVSELGRSLDLDSGTLTPLLKRMEAAGLVARTRSLGDQRHVSITLMSAGRALKKKAATVQEQVICATQCSIDELEVLIKKLNKLRQSLSGKEAKIRANRSLPLELN